MPTDVVRFRMGRKQARQTEERIERAAREAMNIRVVSEPEYGVPDDTVTIIEAENEDSDSEESSVHTVVPDELYCSCWDARARAVLCKHVLRCAMYPEDVDAGDTVPTEIADETGLQIRDQFESVQDEIAANRMVVNGHVTDESDVDREARLDALRDERAALQVAHDYVSGPREATVSDAAELVRELVGDEEADEFESMVQDALD